MSVVTQAYFDFLTIAKYSYVPAIEEIGLLDESLEKFIGGNALSIAVQSTHILLYLPEGKYLAVSPAVRSLFGYSPAFLMDAGVEIIVNNYHPEDKKVYFENIFFTNLDYLRSLPLQTHNDFRFSHNFRLKTKEGDYRHILQKYVVLRSAPDGTPLLMLILATDITHYKSDSRIIHTIEQLNGRQSRIMYTNTHLTEDGQFRLSRKEREILKWITEGLSSRQMADNFFLSIHTINNHRKNILEKTGCTNVADLFRYAEERGLH